MRVAAATIRWDNGATTITTGKATAQFNGQPASQTATLSMLIPKARKDEMPEITKDIMPDMMRLNTILAKRGGIIVRSFSIRDVWPAWGW